MSSDTPSSSQPSAPMVTQTDAPVDMRADMRVDMPAPAQTDRQADAHALSRVAVERVLARASELHNAGAGDPTDAISEARLLDIAREVGLSPSSVRQALAEERTRISVDEDESDGWLTRLAGPGVVSATRTVRGIPFEILAELDVWMQREECLQVQRHFPDRMIWEARSDWFGALKRGLRIGGRAYQLSRAHHVAATVVAVDDESVVVRLDADVTPRRQANVRGGAAVGAGGVALAGTLGVVGVVAHAAATAVLAAAVLPVGMSVAGAYLFMKGHRDFAARTKLALEQMLDRIEYTNVRRPASPLEVFATGRPLLR